MLAVAGEGRVIEVYLVGVKHTTLGGTNESELVVHLDRTMTGHGGVSHSRHLRLEAVLTFLRAICSRSTAWLFIPNGRTCSCPAPTTARSDCGIRRYRGDRTPRSAKSSRRRCRKGSQREGYQRKGNTLKRRRERESRKSTCFENRKRGLE